MQHVDTVRDLDTELPWYLSELEGYETVDRLEEYMQTIAYETALDPDFDAIRRDSRIIWQYLQQQR